MPAQGTSDQSHPPPPILQASQLPQWLPDQWKINRAARMVTMQNPALPTK
jgi:hypothetical protein